MSEKEINERITFISFAIPVLAEGLLDKLQNSINQTKEITTEVKDIIFVFMIYAMLFEAEKFYEQMEAQEFTLLLKEGLESRICEVVDGEQEKILGEFRNAKNSVKHFSYEMLKILNRRDAVEAMEIASIYVSFLEHEVPRVLIKAWSLNLSDLE